MRLTAIKSILAAIVVTTGALPGHVAKAETRLNVPFSFAVSGQTMPASVYVQFGPRTTSRLDTGPAPYNAARLSQGR
jgi:hypothetical protein